jgi:hypothetical protein
LSEEGYKLESISEYKIMNSLNNLDSYEYKDNSGNKIDKECLLIGDNPNFLVCAINQINRERVR